MYQVLVKTTAVMNGAYTFLVEDRAAAVAFGQRPDVFWYHLPLEDDDWRWHRGGAWKPAHEVTQADLDSCVKEPESGPAQVTVEWKDDEDDDGEDDRW